jgi:hypothetical protein
MPLSPKSGYYFYDLEFQQKHKDKEELENDKNNNKPDMLAIKFNTLGKPEKLVIVEVKCMKAAWKGSAGLHVHINKMKAYFENKERKAIRAKEAYLILTQYAKLGLRNLNPSMTFEYDDFQSLKTETLIVLTDEAKKLWIKDKKIASLRAEAVKYICKEYPEADFYSI